MWAAEVTPEDITHEQGVGERSSRSTSGYKLTSDSTLSRIIK